METKAIAGALNQRKGSGSLLERDPILPRAYQQFIQSAPGCSVVYFSCCHSGTRPGVHGAPAASMSFSSFASST